MTNFILVDRGLGGKAGGETGAHLQTIVWQLLQLAREYKVEGSPIKVEIGKTME